MIRPESGNEVASCCDFEPSLIPHIVASWEKYVPYWLRRFATPYWRSREATKPIGRIYFLPTLQYNVVLTAQNRN